MSLPPATPGVLEAPVATPDVPVIVEPLLRTSPPERAQPSLEAARLIVVPVATPKPTPKPAPKTSRSISGAASWYCRAGVSPCTYGYPDDGGFDAYAAAGPKLRAAIGSSWRGRIVYVDGIRVKLIDWCQCYKGEPHEKLLDLYYDVFARAGSSVTVRW